MANYRGSVKEKKKTVREKPKLNWVALIIWVGSILASFISIYVHVLTWLLSSKDEKIDLWQLIFDCITKQDMLWIFSTVLLFAIVNCAVNYFAGQHKKMAKITGALIAIGIALFVFLEITWAVFKYFTSEYITWVVVLSVILMLAALVISTPLQIDSLKDEV